MKDQVKTEAEQWSEEAGVTRWYLYELDRKTILDDVTQILDLIRSRPDTHRHRTLPENSLSEIRLLVEKHIKNSYFKQKQAPVGVRATLKAWMELS